MDRGDRERSLRTVKRRRASTPETAATVRHNPRLRYWPLFAAAAVAALAVRVWESDWMLERQAAHASPAEIRAMAGRLPGSAIVQYHYARSLAALGNRDEAIATLERARADDPGSARVVTELADMLERQARFGEAGALTEDFARSHPDSAEAHFALGVYLYRVFARPQAVAELQQAVRLAPGDARAWRILGESHLAVNKIPDGIAAFTKALTIEPNDPQTLIRRGMARAAAGDQQSAERDMRAALRIDPASAEARFELADQLAKHSSDEKSRREAETILDSLLNDPVKSTEAQRELGRLLTLEQRWKEAEAHLAAFVQSRPDDTEGLYLYADALRHNGKPAQAVMQRFTSLKAIEETRRVLLSRVQAEPNDISIRIRLARFLAAHGEPALAIVCYERAIRSEPGNRSLRSELEAVVSRAKEGPSAP